MKLNEIVDAIIKIEWPMFHMVNGEARADCQEDQTTFEAMRRAQFSAWSEQAAESYLHDLEQAQAEGRNLAREKYIRMMESTDPDGYARFQGELPAVSAEKKQLVADIWARMLAQTERLREKYPVVSMAGRPLRKGDAGESEGWASVETYQVGELMTCSETTLKALLAHIEDLEARGIDLAAEIQLNSVKGLGYPTLEEAEKAIAFQYMKQFECGSCGSCGCS